MVLKIVAISIALAAIVITGVTGLGTKTTPQTMLVLPGTNLTEAVPNPTQVSVGSKSITRFSVPESQIVFLEGEVGENVQLVSDELKSKSKAGKELYLLINSPGGSVLDGSLLLSTMESLPVKVNTVCTKLCASMAFVIHQFGAKRMMVDRAIIMAHPAAGGVQGSLDQMQSRLSVITRYVMKVNETIAKRAGLSVDAFRNLYLPELWLDSEDATSKHFNDQIVDINTTAKPKQPINIMQETTVEPVNTPKFDIKWI